MTKSLDPNEVISLRITDKIYAVFSCVICASIGSVALFFCIAGLVGSKFVQDESIFYSLFMLPIAGIAWWWCSFELYRAFFTKYDALIDRAGIHLSNAFSGQTIPWNEICDSSVIHHSRPSVSLEIVLTKNIRSLANPLGSNTVNIGHRAFALYVETLNWIEHAEEAIQYHRKLAGW